MGRTKRVTPEQFSKAMQDTINGVRNSVTEAISDAVNTMPARAQSTAFRHFNTVLNIPTGHLRRGIEGFARHDRDGAVLGLRVNPGQHPLSGVDRTVYGRALEFGTPPYTIKPKKEGGRLKFKVGGRFVSVKKVNHPGLSARKFLETPLRRTVKNTVARIKKIIRFK